MQVGHTAGKNVAELRLAKGWTQEAFARRLRRLGLSWSRESVSALEAGRRPDLSISEAVLLARALEVPVADLFAGGGDVAVGDTAMLLAELRDRLSGRPSSRSGAALDLRSYAATERGWARRLGLLPHEVRAAADRYWGETVDGKVAMIVGRLMQEEGRQPDIAAMEDAEREAFAELEELLEMDVLTVNPFPPEPSQAGGRPSEDAARTSGE